MAAANDDDIEFLWVEHGVLFGRKAGLRALLCGIACDFTGCLIFWHVEKIQAVACVGGYVGLHVLLRVPRPLRRLLLYLRKTHNPTYQV